MVTPADVTRPVRARRAAQVVSTSGPAPPRLCPDSGVPARHSRAKRYQNIVAAAVPQRPTASNAVSRQPDEDGFVAPPRRHTARAAVLQPPQPLPTTSTFPGANVDEMEDGEAPLVPPQKKPPPPPPIVVQWDGVCKDFQQRLDRVATPSTVNNAGRDLYTVTVAAHEEGAGSSSEARVLLLVRYTLPPASLPPPRAGYLPLPALWDNSPLRRPRLRLRGRLPPQPHLARRLPAWAGVAGARGVPPPPLRNSLPPTLRRGSDKQLALRRSCGQQLSLHVSRHLLSGPSHPPLWRRPPSVPRYLHYIRSS
ncbi:wiskott-Aldrich syndrome protein homolog 1-like [Schistocerca americana]|uniref:wiskott-Aldrich syndrome protein homolog 1-like n=1 Tax=Schistocerca americana TaxID=7009 RepID=UPI001F4FAB1D|nr:wiskott-Aldrich syndrome protein homolog 1-like [Schistocerca americana]